MRTVFVIAGGTFVDVAPHFAFAARAHGAVGFDLTIELERARQRMGLTDIRVVPVFTEMAQGNAMRLAYETSNKVGQTFDPATWSGTSEIEGLPMTSNVMFGWQLVRAAGLFSGIRTNADLTQFLHFLRDKVEDVQAVIMAAAVCDFEPTRMEWEIDNGIVQGVTGYAGSMAMTGHAARDTQKKGRFTFGRNTPRLKTRGSTGDPQRYAMHIQPTDKVIGTLRRGEHARKDIFVVGFKTTAGETEDTQYLAGLGLLKGSSINLVLANDINTGVNMVITPEEAKYHVGDRNEALRGLAEMTLLRSGLRFTRSEVVGTAADLVPWEDMRVPANLRTVVDWCIEQGAYKPFNGKTVGHFAARLGDNEFLTSLRHSNFNTDLHAKGLARVVTVGDDKVIAFGAKPSVGGQSQRSVFRDHPGTDCIVHFHCPPRPGAFVQHAEQRPYECGSHECGENTSRNLHDYGNGIKAVMLDEHGPNIVFGKDVPAQAVIDFIWQNFDLSAKTGGSVSAT